MKNIIIFFVIAVALVACNMFEEVTRYESADYPPSGIAGITDDPRDNAYEAFVHQDMIPANAQRYCKSVYNPTTWTYTEDCSTGWFYLNVLTYWKKSGGTIWTSASYTVVVVSGPNMTAIENYLDSKENEFLILKFEPVGTDNPINKSFRVVKSID